MNQGENVGAVVSKKFRSSNENDEQTYVVESKNEELPSKSKAETEAGPYFLGPTVKKYVRAPVTQCLARRKKTDDYYLMKILELDDENNSDRCSFMKRTIFHNEYSILSLLKNQPGVIQLQDFFKEYGHSDDAEKSLKLKRVCMVLECLIPHGHHNTEFIPLNHYLREDRLSENEALHIFFNLLLVLKELHNMNIVHRDIRLSNIILNRRTLKVKLIDFYYAKLLPSDAVLKYNQCRSYSSPDFIGVQQISPKANDMWSAGIILYAMLNGCMPFAGASNYVSFFSSNRSLHEFYLKIMENDCTITNNICISDGTKEILKSILCKVPQYRLTASEAIDMVSSVLALHYSSHNSGLNDFGYDSDQIVPDIPGLDVVVEEDSTSKSESFDYTVEEQEVTESDEEDLDKPPARVESVIKRVSDYQRAMVPSKPPRQNGGGASRDVKYAMLRLGVTSVNNINALSFSYSKKHFC